MSIQRASEKVSPVLMQVIRFLLLPLAILIAAGGGIVGGANPLVAGIAVLAVLLVAALLLWAQAATLVVVFILYSNLAVVAVKFHNVPYFIGAIFPLLLLVPLLGYLLIERRRIVIQPALPFILLFFAVQLAGTVFSRDVEVSVRSVIDFVLEGLVIFLLLGNVVRTYPMLRRVTWALLLAGALLALFPLYQQVTQTFDHNYWGFAQLSETGFRTGAETLLGEVRQYRAAGAIGEQNRYAQIMLMLFPLGLFMYWSERHPLWRVAALVLTSLALTGVALSFSRGAAVGFVLLLGTMVGLRVLRPSQFALILVAIGLVLVLLPQYRTRVTTLTETTALFSREGGGVNSEIDGSLRGRTTEMMAAVLVFADYPVLGVGPGMFKYYSQEYGNDLGIRTLKEGREAHSLYLDIAANHGVLGLITFFSIFVVTLRQLAQVRQRFAETDPQRAALATGYMLAIISYLTTGLFLHLSYARYLWLMLALAGAAGHIALKGAGTGVRSREPAALFKNQRLEDAVTDA